MISQRELASYWRTPRRRGKPRKYEVTLREYSRAGKPVWVSARNARRARMCAVRVQREIFRNRARLGVVACRYAQP